MKYKRGTVEDVLVLGTVWKGGIKTSYKKLKSLFGEPSSGAGAKSPPHG
jgi:hypothetical protein